MKSSATALTLIAFGLVGGLVFAQTGGNLPAPDNFVPPASKETPPPPAPPAENPQAAPAPGGQTPTPMSPPPKDQGLKSDSSPAGIPPAPELAYKIQHRPPEPFDFESSEPYDETKKRDIFYYRLITDLYRMRDGSGPVEGEVGQDPLIGWDLDNFDVLGIMWDVAKPKAILRDPLGRYHNLTKGMKIGVHGGTVIGIREGEIIVMEYTEEEDRVVKKPRVMVIKNKTK